MITLAKLQEIATANAEEAWDQRANPQYQDAFASYLINALDTLEEEGIPSYFRPTLVTMYVSAWHEIEAKHKAKRKPKARKYYTLCTWNDDHWACQFGDYDHKVVEVELEDYVDQGFKRKHLRIVVSDDTQEGVSEAARKARPPRN